MTSSDPRKKSLASRLLAKFTGNVDLHNEVERARSVGMAADAYALDRANGLPFEESRRHLDALAEAFREAQLPVIEIYRTALRDKQDAALLRYLVAEYEEQYKESKPPREVVELFWALTVAEPSDLTHFYRLFEHYRTSDEPSTLVRLEEQIVQRVKKIRSGQLPQGPDPAANEEIFQLAVADLSQTYADMGRVDADASVVYEAQVGFEPNDNATILWLSRCYRQALRHDSEALSIYEKAFVLEPDDPALRRVLVDSYLEQGEPEKAIVLMESLFQRASDDFGLLTRIVHYYRSRYLLNESSIQRFKEYAAIRPDDIELHRMIAEYCAMRQDLSTEAAGYYKRALPGPVGDGVYHQLLARHYIQRSAWDQAVEILEPLRRAGLLVGDALLANATARAQLGMIDPESALIYERALAAGSRSKLLYNTLSLAYIRMKRLDATALLHFEATIALDSHTPWGYLGVAAYYFRLDEPQNAYLFATQHVNYNPADSGGRRLAGFCLGRLLTADAIEQILHLADDVVVEILLAAFDETGSDARILLPLAQRLPRLFGQDAEMRRVFEALRQLYPNDPVVLDTLREICRKAGDGAAESELDRTLALLSYTAEPQSVLARGTAKLKAIVQEALKRQCAQALQRKSLSREDEEVLRLAVDAELATPDVYRRLALLCADRNETGAEVIGFYEKALAHNPELLALRHLLLQSYIAVGRYTLVFAQATDLLLSTPYNGIVLNLVVQCLMHEGAYDPDLHELIKTHYEHRISDAKTTLAYALFNYRAGRLDREALIVYERALEHAAPEQAMLLRAALARCYELNDEPQKALEVYQRILTEIPDDLQILRRLALNSIQAGDTRDRAHDELIRAALQDGPYDLDLYLKLADFYINRRNPIITQFLIDRISENSPDAMPRVLPLLEKAMRMGLGGPALTIQLAEYYFLDGKKAKALRLLGQLGQLNQRQAEAAVQLYNIMLAQDGDDLEVRRRRGETLAQMGVTLQAVEDLTLYWEEQGKHRPLPVEFIQVLERFLAESTTVHPRLLMLLARSFYRAGRYNDCIRLCQRVLKQMRHHPDALFHLGIAYYQRKEWDQARRVLLSMHDRRPDVIEWLYRLACDYQRVDDIDNAREVLNAILWQNNDFRDCRERDMILAKRQWGGVEGKRSSLPKQAKRLGLSGQGRYDLVSELGRSPLATVYKAYDRELDEIVALKVLASSLASNSRAAGIFLEEARRAKKLQHPGLLRIRDIHSEGDSIFLNLEYCERGHVLRALAHGAGGFNQTVYWIQMAAEALTFAHQHDLLHGNLRPENVLVTGLGATRVCDFGLHRLYANPAIFTPRIVVRQPLYTAPEVLLGEPVSRSADIYSFGAVAYAILSGAPPFTGGDLEQRHLNEPPRPLAKVPEQLNEAVLNCLEKSPRDRPSDLRELVKMFQSHRAEQSRSGTLSGSLNSATGWARRAATAALTTDSN